jgi:soluble lytic murein transglycosylase
MIFAPALLALAVAPPPPPDPRPPIVELTLARRVAAALARTDDAIRSSPEAAPELGLDLLRADLLERLGRSREAAEAYALALSNPRGLAPWARLRLSELQERMGHPEVAAGLIATLFAEGAPPSVVRPGLDLLHRTLEAGGDCRLLGGVRRERLPGAPERRLRDLVQADCWLREGRSDAATRLLDGLLDEEDQDALAWEAAARLGETAAAMEPEIARKIGLAAFHHREFDGALRYLGTVKPGGDSRLDGDAREVAYAIARSLYWLGRYEDAAAAFAEISRRAGPPSARADAHCQMARSLELAGRQAEALVQYRRSAELDPGGEWAASAQLGAFRLEVLLGEETAARTRLTRLLAEPGLESAAARAALFVAVHDLLRGRIERVEATLALASRSRDAVAEEVTYWRGRLAEARSRPEEAVDRYADLIGKRPFHPLAAAARRRLASPSLAPTARQRGMVLAASGDPRSLHGAWSLLGDAAPEGAEARRRGLDRYRRDRATAAWIGWTPVPVSEWPIWSRETNRPEELLLALGLFPDGAGALGRHFPISDLRLSFTGAAALQSTERGTRRGLALAESLFERRPRSLPLDWVAPDLLRLLYPYPWRGAIRIQSAAHRVDPALLAAILREESRFDPGAVSAAAARGLAQFTLPTARRLARRIGLAQALDPESLHDPAIAIPLGAAYLAELARRFPRSTPIGVAAYNAGEDQAALWHRYCLTAEPEEYLAKIGFRETRAYVVRVLESQAAYRALYGGSP